MEDNKQTRSTIVSWTLIGVAFVVIILFLLMKFINGGKSSAKTQSQDKLISYVSSWADGVYNSTHFAEDYANVFASLESRDIKFAGSVMVNYAESVTANSEVDHILFCEDGKVIADDSGDKNLDFDISGYEAEESNMYVINADANPYGEDFIAVYSPTDVEGRGVMCLVGLAGIAEHFKLSTYEEVSFLAITTKEGDVLGTFDKFQDTDSNFLKGNIVSSIAQGATSTEEYNIYKVKLYNGVGTAVSATAKGDSRTIANASVGIKDWQLSFGVRQSYITKLTGTYFSDVKSTVIKLAIVIAVFSVFIFSTIVFNQIRSKERGKVLEDKADTDLLTELNNKAATERKIQEYLENNPNGRAMMFILDIDNFKKINDTMGHAFGDTLLKTLGKEIKTEFRMTDIIGRTGGDEFMVFLKDVTDDLIIEREANRITRFFHDFKAGGDYVKYSASASIGAAIFPDDAKNFKDLYIAADQALYRAKKRGKNQLVFYNEAAHK